MQWYAQDAVAATGSDDVLFDFSIDVDDNDGNVDFNARNSGSNFLWYNKIGAIGFLGFNGAALPDDEDPYFDEACNYFASSPPSSIYVLGHWDADSNGIIGVPDLRAKLATYEGCSKFGDKLKYLDGHTHCNYVQEKDIGFMIGGHGMGGCTQFGFAYVKNDGAGNDSVYYFEEHSASADNYDEILSCISSSGIEGCLSLATKWL